jgi:general secretion pathway protein G
MQTLKHAFTMIELIFVIIIIGILATIAIPRFGTMENHAVIASGRSDVMSIRAAISTLRQKSFVTGNSAYVTHLDNTGTGGINAAGVKIFDNNGTATDTLLTYPIVTKNASGHWMKTAADQYTYYVDSTPTVFDYNSSDGTFDCTSGSGYCDKLTQ